MPVNEKLLARVRELIAAAEKNVEEKKMFGGICFMVNDKMCVGVRADSIMVRVDPELAETLVEKEGAELMVHNGRVMKGYIFVDETALDTKKELGFWVGRALDFNKFAKSSKKK
ncbi:TfoX/Sxy family protein [Chitinophaga sp. YIM B06452]|uniref:TfoX/Sxy family protein n=1 Tax=Chitinophaga sp. YIM B06452 TaxID=3082158 RepID=UPI0031FF368C